MKFDPKKKVHNSLQPKSVDVSVITVNYNGYEDTCEMIESLRELIHSVAYEIIVIDKLPNNEVIDKILELPYSSFDRHYVSDNLNHDVITIYY